MKMFIPILGIMLFFNQTSIFPTKVNGRFIVQNLTSTTYTVLFQINTNTGTDDLGGATIVFGYDTSAISFPNNAIRNVDFIFHNFSGGNYSYASITKPAKNKIWINIDLPFAHSNYGTVVAGNPNWTNVVTLNFDVINQNNTPGLCWYFTSMFWAIYDANNTSLWEAGNFEGNFGLELTVKDGWNLVSVPGINPTGQGINSWWPGRNQTYNVYKLTSGYHITITTTQPGEGYWMYNNGNNVYNTGDEWPASGIQRVPNTPINVSSGWNSIGGFDRTIQINQITTTPPGLIASPFYTFSNEYRIVNVIEPGHGYVVKLNGQGKINYPDAFTKENGNQISYFKDDWGKITFTDNSNRIFSLYLINDEIDLDKYELPPLPPEQLFDIRFESGRIAEKIGNEIKFILMSGVNYPVKVMVENINVILQDESGKIIDTELATGEEITISNETITKLKVTSDKFTHPADFALMQNYPNPFNPSTKISFTIPLDTDVNLGIYNVLGELVVNLVSDYLKAGYYEYQFNAAKLASGIYIYRIKAGDFISSKKMVLIK